MNSKDSRTADAAAFMVKEYGDRAIEEAEKGLRHAREINSEEAIEAFAAILECLKQPKR